MHKKYKQTGGRELRVHSRPFQMSAVRAARGPRHHQPPVLLGAEPDPTTTAASTRRFCGKPSARSHMPPLPFLTEPSSLLLLPSNRLCRSSAQRDTLQKAPAIPARPQPRVCPGLPPSCGEPSSAVAAENRTEPNRTTYWAASSEPKRKRAQL